MVENIRILCVLALIDISWSSIVDIVTSLWAGWSGVQISIEIFFLKVQTGSGAHLARSEMGILVLSLECDVAHLPASSAKVNNEWRYNCTFPYMT